MMARMMAWAVLAGVVYGVYLGVSGWHSPWSMPVPAVVHLLPAAGAGCGEACRHD